ncbi:MAG: glycosyltransferase [Bacteroidetes bacterium]|nr:glycosyltransferase [Bacteroidota bacterium]
MQNEIIAAVITYYPMSNVLENIKSYYSYFNKIIIVDNSDSPQTEFYNSLENFKKIILIKNGENLGIGAALNTACKMAEELDYKWVMTMDQDSFFETNSIENYINCLSSINKSNLGCIGINYIEKLNSDYCKSEIVHNVITSGTFVNLSAWSKIGGFNQNLFIDGVDDEFCFNLILGKFQVLLLPNIYLSHNLGENKKVKQLKFGKLTTRNLHSPTRIYYMTRNYLFLSHKYKLYFPEKRKEYRKALFNKFKNSFLYNSPIQTMRLFIKGYYHFKVKKFGKL